MDTWAGNKKSVLDMAMRGIGRHTDINILIVDDRLENLIILEGILQREGINIVKALSGDEALRQTLEYDFALILLDVQMPGMNGFETADLIRSSNDTRHIPIIFVTALNHDQKHIFRAYESGAVDYLSKPIDPHILICKVNIFIDLYIQKTSLQIANEQLVSANQTILEHQEKIIQEERLRLLLQISGASASELYQPLMMILDHIKTLKMKSHGPEEMDALLSSMAEAGQQLARISERIQLIPHIQIGTLSMDGEEIDRTLNILWVEDDDMSYEVMKQTLDKRIVAKVTRATRINDAKLLLITTPCDLMLLDLNLPDGDAFDLLTFLKTRNMSLPIVILTGSGDEIISSRCIQAGAHEYLPKSGFSIDNIVSCMKKALEKFRLQKDIHQLLSKMAEMATRDELTGLHNRRSMTDILKQEINRGRQQQSDLSCLLLDLDYFKQVNDTYGHACGDYVLKEFAKRLREQVRQTDYAFRYGGEEFMVLLPQTGNQEAMKIAENIRHACMKDPFIFQGHCMNNTVSIGMAVLCDCRPDEILDIISLADKALYQAKAEGRNCVRMYYKSTEGDHVSEENIYGGKGFRYLKDQLKVILDKTKKSALKSIELLIKNAMGGQISNRNHRIVRYLTLICDKLNLPPSITSVIVQAALLHECFKILLGDELIRKKDALTPEEKNLIKSHPHMLVELTELFDFLSYEKTVLLLHHENFDGSGYPYGLKSDEIPLGARIFAVADAFTAMTSEKPYRERLSPEKVISELKENSGHQFDPMLVTLLLNIIKDNNLFEEYDE